MSSSPPGDKPVFFDLGGKRWPRTRRLVALSGVLLFLGMVCFVQSLLIAPPLVLPLKLKKLKEQLRALEKQGPAAANTDAANAVAIKDFYLSDQGKKRRDSSRPNLRPATPARRIPAARSGWDSR